MAFGCELSHAFSWASVPVLPLAGIHLEEVLGVGLQIFRMDAVILAFVHAPKAKLESKCIERFDGERQIQVFTHLAA